jgi:hypothetical protein
MKQGRYPLYRQAMTDYLDYGDEKRLEEAQYLRNRMFLPFRVVFQLKGEQRYWDFPSTATLAFIQDLAKIKFKSWDELQNIIDEKTRYGFGS